MEYVRPTRWYAPTLLEPEDGDKRIHWNKTFRILRRLFTTKRRVNSILCHLYALRLPEQTAMFLTTVLGVSVNAMGLSDLNGICSLSHVFTSNITALIYWN